MSSRAKNQTTRGALIELVVDGHTVTAHEGETIASVLLLLQDKSSCYQTRSGHPRMMYCNMGVCFECRVKVTQENAPRWVLACVTPVQPEMVVETDVNLSQWLPGESNGV
ncbi:MAG: (2Fe-2S)-binding protein [Arenicella sp.]|jgi:ferredoxin|nr:(2Fe-2S)-binding protein [Arenicella sp.]